MSKIICDICGTIYPENATACPICGYPRQDDDNNTQTAVTVQAVKGGRFSNKNVQKRNSAPAESGYRSGSQRQEKRTEINDSETKNSNRSLRGVAVVLLIAVILVGAYIGWRFWDGKDAYTNSTVPVIGTNPVDDTQQPQQSQQPQESQQTEPVETGIPCIGMTVSNAEVEFKSVGRGWLLDVRVQPEDTTDKVIFASSDPNVATVTAEGRITSVGPGTAVITITCGGIVQECVVNCTFGEVETTASAETTEPVGTTEPTEATNAPADENWKINKTDVTIKVGETFTLKVTNDAGQIGEVDWKASRDGVVTIKGNQITGKALGTVNVSVTINGETYTCIVRVVG